MTGMLILKPLAATWSGAGTGIANLQSPSPREVWRAAGVGNSVIELDLGAAVDLDAIYLGNTNASADATWMGQTITGLGGSVSGTLFSAMPIRLAGNIRTRHPAFVRLPAPTNARFLRLTFSQSGVPLEIGVAVPALSLELPYAFGSGRMPVDTSRVVSLIDGGFGIDRGSVKALLQWRFVDLDNAALSKLWAISEDRGESAPLVVIEGPDDPPIATGVHYGLFRRFEAFEREDPANTKWAMSLEEWR